MPQFAAGEYSRRELLRIGGLAFGGVTLPELLRRRAQANPEAPRPKCRAVIQIYTGGGPSHLDMYDMKPDAAREVRGEFQPINTNVEGIQVSEYLPYHARVMDKMTVVRSGQHAVSGHSPASHLMQTGYIQAPNVGVRTNSHPGSGAVVSKLIGSGKQGLPAYVAVPLGLFFGNSAYLGPSANPFVTEGDPAAKDFRVQSLALEQGLTLDRLNSRHDLLSQFDTYRRDLDQDGSLAGLDEYSRQAMEMVTSSAAAKAFQLHEEPAEVRERYGWTGAGQNYLLARRLVEAGVTYVTCRSGADWDTHVDNFNILKNKSLPNYDRALAALIGDLAERGLDKEVLVVSYGEFGRTPVVNKDAGRDHWPGAMSIVFAGGGLKTGQVIGATDSHGAAPITTPISPGDVLSTIYHALGIDLTHTFTDASGRIMPLVPEGKPIAELI